MKRAILLQRPDVATAPGGDAAMFAPRVVVIVGDGSAATLVESHVGLGIVPDNALARAFRDHAGRLHQDLAARAGRVVFMVAGLPMMVKDSAEG